MIAIELPKLELEEIELESDIPVTKGQATTKERIKGRFGLGARSMLINAASVADDPELSAFMRANAGKADFYLVHIDCSFIPRDGEPFKEAWLTVELTRADDGADSLPIVWSMEPIREQKKNDITRTASLKGQLKLVDSGVDAGQEIKKSYSEDIVHIQAYAVQDSRPFWEFRETELSLIDGIYRLKMVVWVPKQAQARGVLQLSATIQRKVLGLIPYHSDFPDTKEISVSMP